MSTEFWMPLNNGYRFHKKLLRYFAYSLYGWAVIGILIFGYQNGEWHLWNQRYFSCPKDAHAFCENPFYQTCSEEICKKEFFRAGETMGTKPPQGIEQYAFAMWLWMILALVINHFQFNRKVEWKI